MIAAPSENAQLLGARLRELEDVRLELGEVILARPISASVMANSLAAPVAQPAFAGMSFGSLASTILPR